MIAQNELLKECKDKFNDIFLGLKKEIQRINIGQATPEFLDMILVDPYGSGKMKINSLGTINVRDNRNLTIQVWDHGIISKIITAINDANLNVLVKKEKELIIVTLPMVTQDFRKVVIKKLLELVNKKKDVLKESRRVFREKSETIIKNTLGEDANKRVLKDIEEYKNNTTKLIDELFASKKKSLESL